MRQATGVKFTLFCPVALHHKSYLELRDSA